MISNTSSGILSKQQGFTLFEIVIVVLIIGVLMTFAIDRMLQLQITAERVSVQHMIGTLSSAVNLQGAELVVEKGLGSLKSLENTNPMQYLSELPYNYIGIKSDSTSGQLPTQSWYFDPQLSILVYTVQNKNYFESSLEGVPRIRLKVSLIYKDDMHSALKFQVRGISVKSLDEYNWKLLE